ncbi:MAG: response regulator [Hyphomicrobiales bacterium]|nr:response regulator [Hyphomicrobiales bacterium]
MAASRIEAGFEEKFVADRDARHGLAPDLSRVLVVGNSQINRIVVARIVERCGLRPVSEAPANALRVLPLLFPGLVILDGGPDNMDCDNLVAGVAALRRVSGNCLPAVILLSSRAGAAAGSSLERITDAIVTKPFTTEQLQPAIENLVKAATA